MGVSHLVVRPQNWDELGKGPKTDAVDALALVQRRDRYGAGHPKALAVVRPPPVAQERRRALGRLRDQLRKHRHPLHCQGKSFLL